jgi:hypothetical protein
LRKQWRCSRPVSTFDDSTAPALQRKMRGRGLTLTHDGGDHRAERGEAAPAGSGRRRMGAGRGRRGSLRPPTWVAGRLGGGGGSPDGGSCGGWGRPRTGRIGGWGRKKKHGRLKVRTTLPRLLAPYLHGTTPKAMAPYKNRTTPCLLAPTFLTEFVPHHGGSDVAQDSATSLGAVPCT